MAVVKDIPEVYLCQTDDDRNGIPCFAGQKCIMQNGDIYICFKNGEWTLLGNGGGGGGGITNIGYATTFNVDNTPYYIVSSLIGSAVSEPPTPEVASGTFAGWLLDGNLVVFPYTPQTNATLVAKIQEPTPIIDNFDIDATSGTIYGDDTVIGKVGTPINLQPNNIYKIEIEVGGAIEATIYAITFSLEDGGIIYLTIPFGETITIIDNSELTYDSEAGIQIAQGEGASWYSQSLIEEGQIIPVTFICTRLPEALYTLKDIVGDTVGETQYYNNIASLNLVNGQNYNVEVQVFDPSTGLPMNSVTDNITATEVIENGHTYIALIGGSSTGYFSVYDNAQWDDNKQLVATEGKCAYKADISPANVPVYYQIKVAE